MGSVVGAITAGLIGFIVTGWTNRRSSRSALYRDAELYSHLDPESQAAQQLRLNLDMRIVAMLNRESLPRIDNRSYAQSWMFLTVSGLFLVWTWGMSNIPGIVLGCFAVLASVLWIVDSAHKRVIIPGEPVLHPMFDIWDEWLKGLFGRSITPPTDAATAGDNPTLTHNGDDLDGSPHVPGPQSLGPVVGVDR